MPFRFRLEKVLSVRRLQEESAQLRHAAALARLRAVELAIAELTGCLTASLEDLDGLKRRDELTAEALYLHTLHVAGLRRRLQGAKSDRGAAETEAERTGTELLAAHQAREALEKLRDRQEAAWRQEQHDKDARALDEIAVSRHRAREEESHGP
jgi:flagellar export protein FliJ